MPPDDVFPQSLIHSLTRSEMDELGAALGQPRFRARQIWDWLYTKWAADWDDLRNVPRSLRDELARRFRLDSAVPTAVEGAVGDTRKIVVRLSDGERIEEVLIPARDRLTVCVSSQVGCRFHCAFCASGQAGFRRHLEAGEMVGQVLLAAREWQHRPTHVVFMGIGEPFDNPDAVFKAIRILNDADGLQIGARRITVSTSGVIPGIERLGDEGIQVELSVSLHAPDDELRSSLMPVNRRYPLPELLAACRNYVAKTNRIITFEYTLMRQLNDTPEHARRLAEQLRAFPCRVNLIPLSPVEEFQAEPSPRDRAEAFMDIVRRAGINVTLRASRGSALKAACGQLRYAR